VIALKGARGYGHNDFKITLARRTLRATLADAVGV
jgi:xanthine dehydrogenase YagS FAD-binding subunit